MTSELEIDNETARDLRRLLAMAHGGYWVLSGIWPVIHMPSFEAVTGPKTDKWLVKTVGSLIAVIGAGLVEGARRKRVTPELELMAIGGCLSLTAIDAVYVSKHRVSKIYLLDGVAHSAIALAWGLAGSLNKRQPESD